MTQTTKKLQPGSKETLDKKLEKGRGKMDWKKVLICSSFAAGALLFVTGRRPAGLAVAGIGLATLASDHPEKIKELWRRMPEYIDKSSKFLDMASTLLERLSQQQSGGYRNIPAAGGARY